MLKHIVVTGVKQIGKSTLVNRYLESLGVSYAGFRTKQIAITQAGPVYALEDIQSGRREPISRLFHGKIVGIPATFDTFATQVILEAMKADVPILLFDEIGRFEQNSTSFLSALDLSFSSGKQVIAVLKKEELPHILKIRQRPDICYIDLDEIPVQEAIHLLKNRIGE